MSGELRIGLVGAGWVTQHHLKGWATLAGRARVVAIADPSLERAGDRARAFGIAQTFSDLASMLRSCQLDAVDIAAPRALHADLVRMAAENGLPVLCQKPLAPSLAEAEKLIANVGRHIRLMVHENWRFRTYYRDLAQWLRNGRIGKLTSAQLIVETSGLLPDGQGNYPSLIRQPFMASEERLLVAELLIHHLDTLRFLLGPLVVKACSLSRSCPAVRGEDGAIIQLSTAAGAGVSIFASLAAYGSSSVQTDRLTLLGDKGAIRLDKGELSLAGPEPQISQYDLEETYQCSYTNTLEHFVEALNSGSPFETSPEDNLETLRLVEDCYELSGMDNPRRLS